MFRSAILFSILSIPPASEKGPEKIEQIGIEKSRQSIEDADLVLLVLDASRPLDEQDQELLKMTENKRRILILNKKDLAPAFEMDGAVSDFRSEQRSGRLERSARPSVHDAIRSYGSRVFPTNGSSGF